jgi:hypothetical protein
MTIGIRSLYVLDLFKITSLSIFEVFMIYTPAPSGYNKRLQNDPENTGSNDTTPASKLGNSAGRALRDGTSRSLVKVPSTNVGELALLGQESGIRSNLKKNVSKRS